MIYSAPEKDAEFLLFDVFDVEQIWSKIADFKNIDRSTIEAIIAEGSRLSAQTLFESFQESKHAGCDWNVGQVLAPKEFKNPFKERTSG